MQIQVHRIGEALLMFYAKAGVYLRAHGKTIPDIWIDQANLKDLHTIARWEF